MIGTLINVALIIAGSVIGLLFKNKISERLSGAVVRVLGLCVMGIGIMNMIGTKDLLCLIICMVVGTIVGEVIDIERRMENVAEKLRVTLMKNRENGSFVEAFVSSTVLFCVGAMAINGSIEAGLNHNYSILVSKGVIDGVTAITFAAALGIGVIFSSVPLLVYQGALTLLAQFVGPHLGADVIVEMSAVGGTIILGIGINMLGVSDKKLRVGNMLPAIFLPIGYIPLVNWITSLL